MKGKNILNEKQLCVKQLAYDVEQWASCSLCSLETLLLVLAKITLTHKDEPETVKTTNFSPKAVMMFSLWNNAGAYDKLFQKVYIFFASGALETQACAV